MKRKVLYLTLISGRSWIGKVPEMRTVTLLHDWREESWNVAHYDLPRILFIAVVSYALIW